MDRLPVALQVLDGKGDVVADVVGIGRSTVNDDLEDVRNRTPK